MIHFIIGTRAQLFKMAPIMLECERRGYDWRWVYTAQHKETIQTTLDTFDLPRSHYTIVKWNTEAKTIGKMWQWLALMLFNLTKTKKILNGYTGKKNIVLTHGDTTTAWLAALIGRLGRNQVMHVESGLRSFNIWRPFPEEINRLMTFRLSTYFASPGKWAIDNLAKYKGIKINTKANTQIDTIKFGLEHCDDVDVALPSSKYIVVSVHRYENIFKEDRFARIIDEIEKISKKFQVLFIQHPATKIQLDKLGYRERLERTKSITMLPRQEYLQFVKTIKHAEFVVADGGGNQEELYHIGKPTLLFRDETERQEGIGTTAVISKLDPEIIDDFIKNYKDYRHPATSKELSPSAIIADQLTPFGG